MIKFFFLAALLFCTTVGAFDYPRINSWSGSPIVEYQKLESTTKTEDKFSQSRAVAMKKDFEFKSPFAVVTASRDFLRLNISGKNILEILPKSKMQMPYVRAPSEGEDAKSVNQHIVLIDGHYRYLAKESVQSSLISPVKIETAFFDLLMPDHIELFIDLDMKVPSVTLSVMKGSLLVHFYDYEKKVTLKQNQRVTFVGLKNSEGTVLYDYLLDKRKVPKGKMHAVVKVNQKEAYKYLQEFLTEEETRKTSEEAERIRKTKTENKKYVCLDPKGMRDQCFWKMIDGVCYRFRCNASGEWSDQTERIFSDSLARQKCSENNAVATSCDY